MSDQQPAPPSNASEASSQLAALAADQEWGSRLLAGHPETNAQFHSLSSIVAKGGDAVDQAIAGIVPGDIPDAGQKRMAEAASWMAERGLSDAVIRQTLTNHEVTPQEVRAVEAWKAQKMRSPEFTKAFLAGEPDPVREMLLADIVLSSKVKTGAAA
jgi:hypothetical protein